MKYYTAVVLLELIQQVVWVTAAVVLSLFISPWFAWLLAVPALVLTTKMLYIKQGSDKVVGQDKEAK